MAKTQGMSEEGKRKLRGVPLVVDKKGCVRAGKGIEIRLDEGLRKERQRLLL